jgi:hypothetical protein
LNTALINFDILGEENKDEEDKKKRRRRKKVEKWTEK